MSPVVRRFKVTAGKHHAGNGVIYRMNDVLESTRQLDKLYINKFVEVSDVTPVTAQPDPSGVPPVRATVSAITIDPGVVANLQNYVNELKVQVGEKDKTIAELRNEVDSLKGKEETTREIIEDQNRLLATHAKTIDDLQKRIDGKKPAVPKKTTSAAVEDPFGA